MDFLARNSRTLPGHCHGGESTSQARVWVFSFEQIPVTLSALSNNTVYLLFVHTLSIFASVLCVFGCPLLGSSCTSFRLSLKRLCHSKTLGYFIGYSSLANVNRANVSVTFTDLPTKLDVYPLLQILVTHYSTNSIPQSHTTTSAAWEGNTHLVCGSCKPKLELIQTCLGT
jgi:hypothetical protein